MNQPKNSCPGRKLIRFVDLGRLQKKARTLLSGLGVSKFND